MNQVIRILAIVFRYKDHTFRYKIAYRRTYYQGYDIATGDALDVEIYSFFEAKTPTQIWWEVSEFDTGRDLSHVLNTFQPKVIPLIIGAKINPSSLSQHELDQLQNRSFPNENREVTLFYRTNMTEQHEDWPFLPTFIRISIDYRYYVQLAQTVFPY